MKARWQIRKRTSVASGRPASYRAALHETALSEGDKEAAAGFEARAAVREALLGNAAVARQTASAAVGLSKCEHGQTPEAVLALALAGDSAQAGKWADALVRGRPLDTEINSIWVPEVRSVIKLNDRKPEFAVDELAPAATYELGWVGALMPAYLRGQACLAGHRGAEAAREFQKILDHRGVVLNNPIESLAHLGLGHAYALEASATQGKEAGAFQAKARAAYEDFLTLWKDTDPDIPILREAKSEYERLK